MCQTASRISLFLNALVLRLPVVSVRSIFPLSLIPRGSNEIKKIPFLKNYLKNNNIKKQTKNRVELFLKREDDFNFKIKVTIRMVRTLRIKSYKLYDTKSDYIE
jgi:hypothetical protein